MHSFLQFLQAHHLLGPITGGCILIVAIFLLVKKWIKFSTFLSLFLLSLFITFLFNYQKSSSSNTQQEKINENLSFENRVEKAIQKIETELKIEKENLNTLVKEVEKLFTVVEKETKKINQLIEDTKTHFQLNSSKEDLKEEENKLSPLIKD